MTKFFKLVFLCAGMIATSGCSYLASHKADTQADSVTSKTVHHKVKKGDTLYSIAWHYGEDYRLVAIWNDIDYPYLIKPGQYIYLQPGKMPSASQSRSESSAESRRTPTTQSTIATRRSERNDTSTNDAKSSAKASVSQNVRWYWPTRGKVIEKYSFGRGKKGIVIAGQSGQHINAAAGGRVVYTGSGLQGYGKLIIIKHNDTFLSAYAHNKKIRVKEQEKVKRGQHIADMGKSGTNRTSLHFEIRRNGKPIDPLRYLPKL